jgi:hypothetical protein
MGSCSCSEAPRNSLKLSALNINELINRNSACNKATTHVPFLLKIENPVHRHQDTDLEQGLTQSLRLREQECGVLEFSSWLSLHCN